MFLQFTAVPLQVNGAVKATCQWNCIVLKTQPAPSSVAVQGKQAATYKSVASETTLNSSSVAWVADRLSLRRRQRLLTPNAAAPFGPPPHPTLKTCSGFIPRISVLYNVGFLFNEHSKSIVYVSGVSAVRGVGDDKVLDVNNTVRQSESPTRSGMFYNKIFISSSTYIQVHAGSSK